MTEKLMYIAKACHEANRVWCQANGDDTQKHWSEAEQWQRDSAIKGVEFRIKNPHSGHDAQHNSWMEEKVNDGWVYGEVKDAEKKTHPCIVPFDQLADFQQKKDALFCAIVDTLSGIDKLQGTPKTETKIKQIDDSLVYEVLYTDHRLFNRVQLFTGPVDECILYCTDKELVYEYEY